MQLENIEAALSASAQFSTFSKHEKSHAGSLGVTAKQHMLIKSHNERASIIDLNKLTKSYALPIINKKAFFVAPVGKKKKIEKLWKLSSSSVEMKDFSVISHHNVTCITYFIIISLFLSIFYATR